MAISNEIRILLNAIYKGAGILKAEDDIKKLAIEVGKASAILAAFALVVKKSYDFGKEGAAIDRLRETGTKLAESYGVDMEEAVAKMKAASHGAISANEAIIQANRAMLLGVARDTDTMAKLLEIAAIRGRAAGLDTEAAFERIILGIGRLSTRVLDDIGIVIDGETAYANYGKSIGKVADDLTEAEKRQALTNAIIEDGNKLLKDTGGLTDDAANAYERWETHITDTTNALKKHISDGVSPLIKTLDIWIFGNQTINEQLAIHAQDVAKTSKTYAEYEAELQRVANLVALHVDANGRLIDTFGNVVQENYLLKESEFNAARATDDHSDAIGRQLGFLEAQAKWDERIMEAQKKLNDITGTAKEFSFEDAAKSAFEFDKALITNQDSLDRLQVAFGLADESVFKFRDALRVVSEDGIISLKELQDAFRPIAFEQAAQKTLELWDKVDKKIQDLRDKYRKDVLDSERELADDMVDAATKRDRDLADLEEENNRKRDDAIADANKKRQRDEEDAESAHQRRIQKILDKYNRSRLQALIDLDARALFEAELTRDQELADAEADRKQKKEDDKKELERKIEDIQSNYEEKRSEILRQYDRDIEDAKEADRRRKRDLERALDEQIAEQEKYRQEEMQNIEQFLAERVSKETLDYQQRLTDLIRYWRDRLQINDFFGGIESGGGPPPGEEPGPPAPLPIGPPDPIPAPAPGGGPVTGLVAAGMTMGMNGGGNGSNIVVTLNVQGDGVLAHMVRQSALNAVIDVVSN